MRREIVGILCALVLVVSLGLLIAGPMTTAVRAASSGPNSGSTAVDDNSIGTVNWSTPSNALAQDDSYATASLMKANPISHYLKVTDFSFAIPSDATIKGIVVGVDRYASTGTGGTRITDNSIRLVKGGAIGGNNKASASLWPSSDTDTYVSYGNSTDLWGLTWAPANINGSGFGVAISATKDTSNFARVAYVDHIRITVYYNRAPVANNQSVSTDEDIAIAINLTASDADGDPLTYSIVTQPSHGNLSGTPPNVTYTPSANYNGSDSFIFKANDGFDDSNNATVSITINPVNDAPVADSQSGLSVDYCGTLTVTLNGTDPDNDPITYIISTLPLHGDLYDGTGTNGTHITSVNYTVTDAAHKVTYQPTVTYSVEDSFGFKVNDGALDSAEATISITVSGCPEDYYTDWVYYCNGTSIWKTRDFHDYYCLNGTCQEDVIPESEWYEDCPEDYYDDWENYCIDNEVWTHRLFHDFSCVNGTCVEDTYYTGEALVEDCDAKNGWVEDGGNYTACNGTQVCTYQDMVYLDYECVGGQCVPTETDWRTDLIGCEDCDLLDYYDDWEFYCVDGELWEHHMFHDFSCDGGECVEIASNYTDDQFVIDCDTFDYYDDWEFYCVDGELWKHHMFHDYSCVEGNGGDCVEVGSYYTDEQFVEDCDDGDPCTIDTCENGQCVHTPIDCDYLDGWAADGSPYTACNGTQVCTYQDMVYLDYECVGGNCVSTETAWRTDLISCESCDDGNPWTIDTCENGQCVHIAAYNLTMAADPQAGGTAADLTNDSPYAEGTEVSIKAVAATGYQFVNWTAPAGTFGNATAATTNFTMPAQNVTVTANFGLVSPPAVYPTVTTQAATGVTTSSATLNMNYTVGSYSSVDVRFAYKKSAESTWSYTSWASKSASGAYAAPLSELTSSTQYDFKAQLRYDSTVIEGTTLQFTTATPSPFGGCFIATAAYGTPTAKQIDVLREFRDVVLLKSTVGSQFVSLYYRLSPPIADFIARHELVRTLVRELVVDPIVWVVEATGDMWRN